ncbi:hypothetical protein [uncultured Draconibacterium sp.]|uniref:hypothetical protein n=1 Tax=uncultured Draconibacterium sp. TaxID=1573823 RepID=UPI0029C80CD1|nr:hypothetical protein [uncultured Draconibacterium sp.]
MNTKAIRKIIEKAIKDEKATHSFANLTKEFARKNGRNMSDQQATETTNLVIAYAVAVPSLLEEGEKAAQRFGIQNEMSQMLRELDQYWKLEQDLLPDNLGLLGITDDAYASNYLLQTLSDYCKEMYGRPLMKTDLTEFNNFVRVLLGNEIASALEQRVQMTIGSNMVNQVFNQVYQNIFSSGFAFGNPFQSMYEQRQIDEQVNVQMGAMGIF